MARLPYMTTFAAGFCSSRCFYLPPHKLSDAANIEHIENFHIYAIVRAPRIRMIPNSFAQDSETDFCLFRIGHEFAPEERRLELRKEFGVEYFRSTDGAGRSFEMKHARGVTTGDFPMLVMGMGVFSDLRDHEIIYVGQAFGASGERNVVDRLLRHETLQRIVSENAIEAPDTDVFVYGFQYAENDQLFIMFDGTDGSLLDDENNDSRLSTAMDSPVDEKIVTQIVEAALIRYFKPAYNKKFKELFPNEHHKFLEDLKTLDYEGFTVEIDTEDLRTRLGTVEVGYGSRHIIKFRVNDRRENVSIIDFYNLVEKTGIDPSSGPIF